VSPLDPTRNFGSLQGDGVGDHTHGLQPITHTHIITDPGHLHGVTDPGHKHEIIDFGHNHTVTDPGHQHDIDALSHTGWADAYSRSNNGLIRMDVTSSSIFYRNVKFVLSSMNTDMVVAKDPANLLLANAQSNVVAGDAFTGVSIDVATTNIPNTEITGNSETRPENMALLPVIRY
jgi:hypothetical protein